jgi:predicted ATP-grasp superfamily ATP-dependent carboligase
MTEQLQIGKLQMYNRLSANTQLSNKNLLFQNLVNYYQQLNINPFDVAIPTTYLINSPEDADAFKEVFKLKPCIWIVKPGENTNRGTGILVTNNLELIEKIIRNK